MTGFVVRAKCDHKPDCDEPNEEPLIVMLFAESDSDQRHLVGIISESKPVLTQPMIGIVSDDGSQTASVGEALLSVLQRFLIWKKVQEGMTKGDEVLTKVPPATVGAEEDNPFSDLKDFDADTDFGSKD